MAAVTHWPVPAQASSKSEFLQRPRAASEPITPALCWAHSRRQFFELADIAKNARRGRSAAAISPIALEAVRHIDALFEIEREIGRAHVRTTVTNAYIVYRLLLEKKTK